MKPRSRIYKIRVCMAYVKSIAQKGLLKEYAQLQLIKHQYRNSTFYNFSIKHFAKQIGRSRTFARRFVEIAIQEGWAILRDGNIVFVNKKHYQSKNIKRHTFIQLKKRKSYKEILKELYRLLVNDKHRQVKYIVKKKQDLSNPTNLKAYKSARSHFKRTIGLQRAEKELKSLREIDCSFNISYLGLGKLFNCSSATAYSIMTTLNDTRDYIRHRRGKILYENISYSSFKENTGKIPHPHYWSNNCIYRILPNQYAIG